MTPEDIHRLRDGMGWTQTQAAARIGVTANTWARWESGDVHPHPLRLPALYRLLRAAERRTAKRLLQEAPPAPEPAPIR